MNFQTLSSDGRDFISSLQFSNRGISVENSVALALALAFKDKCVDPLYYDEDYTNLKLAYRKREEFKNTEILNEILSLVPIDYRFILDLTDNLFVIRVKASADPYVFLTLFSKNDELVDGLDGVTKKIIKDNFYYISVTAAAALKFIRSDLKA